MRPATTARAATTKDLPERLVFRAEPRNVAERKEANRFHQSRRINVVQKSPAANLGLGDQPSGEVITTLTLFTLRFLSGHAGVVCLPPSVLWYSTELQSSGLDQK